MNSEITPTVYELTECKQLKSIECPEIGCTDRFKNIQNLKMHTIKHHRNSSISLKSNDIAKKYFCPVVNCPHNIENSIQKHFTCMKYLKQHYLKVHAEKNAKCSKKDCGKMFSTKSMLKRHEQICGTGLSCAECGWTYGSKEALHTHGKRKNHQICAQIVCIESDIQSKKKATDFKAPISKKSIFILPKPDTDKLDCKKICSALVKESNHNLLESTSVRTSKSTQTKLKPISKKDSSSSHLYSNSQAMKRWNSFGTQTVAPQPSTWIESDEIDNENSNLINNSSQTTNNLNNMSYLEDSISCFANQFDSNLCNNQTQTDRIESMSYDLDQLDPYYNNMHTQTCDDFLSELNLSDIQTQTNWSYQDLLVSTETQTSFSACLMPNTSIQTQTSDSMEFLGASDAERHSNSIHTQT